jgi:hypothetical protein
MDYQGLKDRTLICCDCGKEFVFTVGQQKYFLKKDLSVPKRCHTCRTLRKLDYSPEAKGDK